MVRRDSARVRCFTRNGHDWADRFPAIVDAALRIKASSFLIDGEAVVARATSMRCGSRGQEAVLFAFDLIEHDGDDLRDLPLIERRRLLAKLIGKAKRRAIRFSERLTGDGASVFEHDVGWRWRASCRSGRTRPSQRPVKDVAQVEEPGERGGAAGARGGMALGTSRSLSYACDLPEFILNQSSRARKSSRHRRSLAHSASLFRSRARCRIAKAIRAPVSTTDLKVSLSIGMQACHRMPPLQFWSMIIGLFAGSRGIWWPPFCAF